MFEQLDLSRARGVDEYAKSVATIYQQAAWIMSRCILLSQADQNLSDDERTQVAEQYADRTLKLLQLAIDEGRVTEQEFVNDPRYEPLLKLRPQAIENMTPSSVLVR